MLLDECFQTRDIQLKVLEKRRLNFTHETINMKTCARLFMLAQIREQIFTKKLRVNSAVVGSVF